VIGTEGGNTLVLMTISKIPLPRELEEMGKAQHQREAAQLTALARFYEKHGYLPEGCGFEIADDGFEPINTKVF
jgi:hypothetical protein